MPHRTAQFALSFLVLLALCLAAPPFVRGQDAPAGQASGQSAPVPGKDSSSDAPPTLFPHFESDWFWLSGQTNIITQWHPAVRSPY